MVNIYLFMVKHFKAALFLFFVCFVRIHLFIFYLFISKWLILCKILIKSESFFLDF